MSMTPHGSKGPAATINVTPLIDVLLVLLIIFMVIQPLVPLGLDALVPQPPKNASNTEPDPSTIVVEVAGSGSDANYRINRTAYGGEELGPRLAAIFASRNQRQIFLKGDAGLDFATIAQVIDDAHHAGVDDIAIMTPRDSRE